jgi:hypothetical protein
MKDRSFNKLVQLLETVDPTINDYPAPAQAMEDHEVEMAHSQIDEIIRNAERVKKMLNAQPMNADIEAWIQSKLTLADDYLVSVAGAMANDFKGIVFEGKTLKK